MLCKQFLIAKQLYKQKPDVGFFVDGTMTPDLLVKFQRFQGSFGGLSA